MSYQIRGYWFMAWLGLLSSMASLPAIAIVVFSGPPLQAANISIASGLAWPAAIVGIVACSGLLAQRNWGVILAIVSLSMSLTASLPYGIVRLILVRQNHSLSGLSLLMAIVNLLALIYWCQPAHRRGRL